MNTAEQISNAVKLLNEGKVVAIPTETVYGLAANALNPESVAEIFRIKNRPFFDPLIVHIPSIESAYHYVNEFPDKALKLARKFWPGALTLILPKKKSIPDIVTSGLPFVGLRVPNHNITVEILKNLQFPLAAPSANPFGYVSPTTAQHVNEQLADKVSFIVDGGKCKIGLESTIVFFENPEEPTILRYGGVDINDIENCIGKVKINISSSSKPHSPGLLDKHYATFTPIVNLTNIDITKINSEKTGALVFKEYLKFLPEKNQIILSENGSISESACNLFDSMRNLDKKGFELIVYENFPQIGLGFAINDRLKRAEGS